MSGRATLATAAVLTEIPIFLMDASTGEGVTGVDPGDTGFSARFRRAGETTDTTLTLTAVAAGATLAVNQWREYGSGWYTVVGSTTMVAAGARFTFLTVDCTTPAALADAVTVFLSADDALAASASTGSIATAVDAAVADNFAAVLAAISAISGGGGGGGPSAATISAAVMADLADSDGSAARAAIATAVLTLLADPSGGLASRTAIAELVAITQVGGGDLKFDDASGTSLVVKRKSTDATVATIPLRRGDRTQAIIGNG
jgi:hypothetical protein